MALTITISALRAHRACQLDKRLTELTAHLGRVPTEDEPIPAETLWALPSTSAHDAVWSLRCAEPAEEAHRVAVRVAVAAARAVEHLLPDEGRAACQAAIRAAEAWLKEPTEERVEAARAADRAAVCAADAAYAADAAAAEAAAACAARAARAAVCAADAARAADAYTRTSAAAYAARAAVIYAYDADDPVTIDAAIRAALIS